jgi:hypothetical protein
MVTSQRSNRTSWRQRWIHGHVPQIGIPRDQQIWWFSPWKTTMKNHGNQLIRFASHPQGAAYALLLEELAKLIPVVNLSRARSNCTRKSAQLMLNTCTRTGQRAYVHCMWYSFRCVKYIEDQENTIYVHIAEFDSYMNQAEISQIITPIS